MPVQDHLSTAKGHRDQGPNRELADKIVQAADKSQLKELVDFYLSKPHKDLQKDAILTMAWVAEKAPKMLVSYADLLVENVNSEINRVVWGSMIALSYFGHLIPDKIFESVPKIVDAMDAGTPVTRDYGFRLLIVLYEVDEYREDISFIILEQVELAPDNQLGQYAERWIKVIKQQHSSGLIKVLEERRSEMNDKHHLKRLDKNLKKLNR